MLTYKWYGALFLSPTTPMLCAVLFYSDELHSTDILHTTGLWATGMCGEWIWIHMYTHFSII